MPEPPSGLDHEQRLRHELKQLLIGRNAHLAFEEATADFPAEHINTCPPNTPYSFWHLVEHMRIAQLDILNFVLDPAYESPQWPAGYWPERDLKATPADWQNSIDLFLADRARLAAMLDDPQWNLTAELAHAPGYTLLREINVAADHNAYHVGELAILRGVLGLWPPDDMGVT